MDNGILLEDLIQRGRYFANRGSVEVKWYMEVRENWDGKASPFKDIFELWQNGKILGRADTLPEALKQAHKKVCCDCGALSASPEMGCGLLT